MTYNSHVETKGFLAKNMVALLDGTQRLSCMRSGDTRDDNNLEVCLGQHLLVVEICLNSIDILSSPIKLMLFGTCDCYYRRSGHKGVEVQSMPLACDV